MTVATRIEYCDCGKAIDCEGLGTRSQPVGYEVGISGIKVMEASGNDFGHAPSRRIGMSESPGGDRMTGVGGNSARWSDESKAGNDVGRADCHHRPVSDEFCRGVSEGPATVLLGTRQTACRRNRVRPDRTMIAETGVMDTSDVDLSRLRYENWLPRPRYLAEPKGRSRRMLADFSTACAVGGLQVRQEHCFKVFRHDNLTATNHVQLKRSPE